MSAIESTLTNDSGTITLPPIEQEFLHTPIEAAVDVTTLDNSMYTDFTGQNAHSWTYNYATLTKAQYDAIRAYYDAQFTDYEYPLLSTPFYSLSDQPVRMYINEKNIWDNCGDIQNVQITFRETSQLVEVS